MRFSPTPEMVRSQRIATFQAPVLDVLGKVRDVGHEHADAGGEEEQRRNPAVGDDTNTSAANRGRGTLIPADQDLLRPLARLVPERGPRELLAQRALHHGGPSAQQRQGHDVGPRGLVPV